MHHEPFFPFLKTHELLAIFAFIFMWATTRSCSNVIGPNTNKILAPIVLMLPNTRLVSKFKWGEPRIPCNSVQSRELTKCTVLCYMYIPCRFNAMAPGINICGSTTKHPSTEINSFVNLPSNYGRVYSFRALWRPNLYQGIYAWNTC